MATASDLPTICLKQIFKQLNWKDLVSCEAVCSKWKYVLSDANGVFWANAYSSLLPPDSRKFDLLRGLSHKQKIIAFICTWKKDTVSGNFDMLSNMFSVRRRPIAQSSDVARANVGFSRGIHEWIVRFDSPKLGSHAGVGICTSSCSLHGNGYYCVLGENDQSWGWDVVKHELRHNGKCIGELNNEVGLHNFVLFNHLYTECIKIYAFYFSQVVIGDRIGIILNADKGTVSFELNDFPIGTPFENLPLHKTLYPCISAVYGDSHISMVYVGGPVVG
jgi:F-box protein 45